MANKRPFVPYGKLGSGRVGLYLDSSNNPIAAAVEVLESLPSTTSTENFTGRMVYQTSDTTLYAYTGSSWTAVSSNPATVSSEEPTDDGDFDGALVWDTANQVMYVWDGSAWQAIGGQYATTVLEETYTGDGSTDVFAITGAASTLTETMVEVFVAGVRQTPSTDYTVSGNRVLFSTSGFVPSSGDTVFIRAFDSTAVAQNAKFVTVSATATAATTEVDLGVSDIESDSLFVFVNGALVSDSSYDLNQEDTTISQVLKPTSTTGRFITAASPNGIASGDSLTLTGFESSYYNNLSFEVVSATTNSFTITVDASAPALATTDMTGSEAFSPAFQNDTIDVYNLTVGDVIEIRALQDVALGDSTGETNTLADASDTGVGLAASKGGTELRVKTLLAGNAVTITDNDTYVTIAASTDGTTEVYTSTTSTAYTADDDTSYLGVRNTSSGEVSVDIGAISTTGRRITVKDESMNAETNNITIYDSEDRTFDINDSNKIISTDGGYYTLVLGDNNWFVIAEG